MSGSGFGQFAFGVSAFGAALGNPPLQTIIPSYAFQQYSDDETIAAFVGAYNSLSQGYLDWFNTTPLGLYTSTNISGALLDWTGQGIYGLPRPVVSSLTTRTQFGLGEFAFGTHALGTRAFQQSGTTQTASDDIYKRSLTWHLYRGDGLVPSLYWLQSRVARFIFGTNGGDITVAQRAGVSLAAQPLAAPPAPVLSAVVGGALSGATYYAKTTYVTPLGETTPSAEASLAVATNSLLQAASPAASNGVTGYNVYVATATGAETKQNATPIAIGTAWTEPTSGLISGAALPASNTSVPSGHILITVPNGTAGQFFAQMISLGLLALPFELSYTVIVA